jgi:cytochrome c553
MKSLLPLFGILLSVSCSLDESSKSDSQNDQPASLEQLQQGADWAMATQQILGGALMQQMMTGGPKEAILFCNEHATPFTDSVSTKIGATIRRVSHKNRNPKNSANDKEMAYIKSVQMDIAVGRNARAKGVVNDGHFTGYYPIIMQPMCTACHGRDFERAKEIEAVVKEKYPNDKAIDFTVGDLRGIWVVEY